MSEVAKGKLHSVRRLEVSQLSKPRVSDFGINGPMASGLITIGSDPIFAYWVQTIGESNSFKKKINTTHAMAELYTTRIGGPHFSSTNRYSLTHNGTVWCPSVRPSVNVFSLSHFFQYLPELFPQWSSCVRPNIGAVRRQRISPKLCI